MTDFETNDIFEEPSRGSENNQNTAKAISSTQTNVRGKMEAVGFLSNRELIQPAYDLEIKKCSDFTVQKRTREDRKEIPISSAVKPPRARKSKYEKYSDKLKVALNDPAKFKLENIDQVSFKAFIDYVKKVEKMIKQMRILAHEDRFVLDNIMDQLASETNVVEEGTDLKKDGSTQNGNHKNVPIKGFMRAVAKSLALDYNGDFRQIRDYARGTLEYDRVSEVKKVLDLLKSEEYRKYYNQIYIRDYITDPDMKDRHPAKYRDVKISIQLKSGRVVELQIHLKPLLSAKAEGWPVFIDNLSVLLDKEQLKYLREKVPHIRLFRKIDEHHVAIKTHDIYRIRRNISGDRSKKAQEIKESLRQLEVFIHMGAQEKQEKFEKTLT